MSKKKMETVVRNPKLDLVEVNETDSGFEIKTINTGRVLGCISNMNSLELFLSVLSDEAFE